VEQASSGDLVATLHVEGDPVELSPGLDLAAYRIAQEGLTNALRHSAAQHVDVTLRWTTTRLDIEVIDDGRGVAADPASGGHGLVGIRERVALYGGTVRLEPASGGGTRLSATLPMKGAE
jgi:signal transduction histidine kinase